MNQKAHLDFFRKELIENGAPETITDEQVKASSGFAASQAAFFYGMRTMKAYVHRNERR